MNVWPYTLERDDKLVAGLVFSLKKHAAHLPGLLPHGFTIMPTVLKRPAALPAWVVRADLTTRTLTVQTARGVIFYEGGVGDFPPRFAYAARQWPWCWLYVSGPPVADARGETMWAVLEVTAALGGLVAARARIEVAGDR